MKKSYRTGVPPKTVAELFLSAAAGFGAGIVNGLLGTGGGILLLSVLRRYIKTKDAFASVLVCILPLSALSVILYCLGDTLSWDTLISEALPYLIGAVPGGMLGAYLLEKLKPSALQYLFAMLLLFSGWRMAFS